MKATEHTKGSWRLQEKCEDLVIEVVANGEEIAEIYQHEGREDEGMANAHLMLAAPELLAACRAVLVNLGDPAPWKDVCPDCHEMLRAAVAKATGGNGD